MLIRYPESESEEGIIALPTVEEQVRRAAIELKIPFGLEMETSG
jgi:hypothetical protein